MLFNNEKFIAEVSQHFIGVAASDVAYQNIPNNMKPKGEYKFLTDSLKDGGKSLQQGVFAVTSSGRYLGKIDTGWPIYDFQKSLINLVRARKAYASMSKEMRLGIRLNESERSLPILLGESSATVKLATSARYYDFKEMDLFDLRHPKYSKRDTILLTPTDISGLLPDTFIKGKESLVASEVITKLLINNHFQFNAEAWEERHIQEKSIHVKVEDVDGERVSLSYKGAFKMRADTQWNQSSIEGNLLGRAIYQQSDKVFSEIELISLSDVEVGELKRNMHRGSTQRTKVAAYLSIENDE